MSKWTAFFLSILFSTSIHAEAVEFTGTIPVAIPIDELVKTILPTRKQIVFVQKIHLSTAAQQILTERLEELSTEASAPLFSALNVPARLDLGMNDTPVLDQGVHGSCVTFALTGAIDAIIGKGDFISQLCSLELGDYLHRNHKIQYSGWNGSWGGIVFQQLQDYGLVTKKYQQESGCAGVKIYPLTNEKNTGKPMSISEYSANALPLTDYASWESLLEIEESFTKNYNPTVVLRNVKKNLREGKRITFGVLLDVSQGDAGAVGTFKKKFDTWVLTPEIINHAKKKGLDAGHEMIIIGYDDQAVVRAKSGQLSKGIFILRNSWGKQVGDGGNYYMSYDYFKAFSDEAHVIIPVS